MTTFGYFLSTEEHGPRALLDQAQRAEANGFDKVWISDHFHPWLDEQGEGGGSPFVWGVIGAIAATTGLEVTTAVTCPIIRIHPAIVAQAAATAAVQLEGRFRLGIGTGEALNEHVLGDRWPSVDERLEMLEEAVGLMRELWTGRLTSHQGTHYTVDRARLYTVPDEAISVPMSAFGPKAAEVSARIGDGLLAVEPSKENLETWRKNGGSGPTMAGLKVCWGPDERKAAELVHHLWRNQGVPGELSQELALPSYFDQVSELVSVDAVQEAVACGPDPERHVEALKPYLEIGYDEVFINQVGDDQAGFLDFFRKEVEPRL